MILQYNIQNDYHKTINRTENNFDENSEMRDQKKILKHTINAPLKKGKKQNILSLVDKLLNILKRILNLWKLFL